MASDSACFDSNLDQGEVDSLCVLPSAGLIGCCGEIGAMIRVVDWLKNGSEGRKSPDFPNDCEFEAIVVNPEGEVLYYDHHLAPSRFHAVGSGHKPALGAMMAGTSADKAVQMALSENNR